jgi:hypothetical protein
MDVEKQQAALIGKSILIMSNQLDTSSAEDECKN